MLQRPRRNRKNAAIRDMLEETYLDVKHLIYPLFIKDGDSPKEAIPSLPGIYRWSKYDLFGEIEECMKLGLNTFVLFPAVEDDLKDDQGSYGYYRENFYLTVIRDIKEKFPQATLMSDVALDPYSSDGHDGLVENGEIVNDKTLPLLAKMAKLQAEAGIDIIGPSDMMDGRIASIREALDQSGFVNTSIMSYTAKYASAFYGPFRDALESSPKSGDKKSYQMNPANKKEALREMLLDTEEGADYLMVKPALSYLDIIHVLKENSTLPITAYNVSGEYAMIKAASEKNWLNYEDIMKEVLLSIKRAGADGILTYFAKDFAALKNK